jgi:hypothetical protein
MQGEYAAGVKIALPLHLRRRTNLEALAVELGGVTALADLVESPRPHISAVINGDKPCGNRLAAKIEAKTGRDPGWLDADHGNPVPPAVDISLSAALRVLGSALAHDMPNDIRQDAADLLAKLALRSGLERHQGDLADLLAPFAVNEYRTTETRGSAQIGGAGVDLDRAMSQRPAEHEPANPQQLGGADRPQPAPVESDREGTATWISNEPRTDQQQERRPGERKPSKPGRAVK